MAGSAVEKNQAGILGEVSVAILLWLFMEDLTEEVMFKQRSKRVRGSHVDACMRTIAGR